METLNHGWKERERKKKDLSDLDPSVNRKLCIYSICCRKRDKKYKNLNLCYCLCWERDTVTVTARRWWAIDPRHGSVSSDNWTSDDGPNW